MEHPKGSRLSTWTPLMTDSHKENLSKGYGGGYHSLMAPNDSLVAANNALITQTILSWT